MNINLLSAFKVIATTSMLSLVCCPTLSSNSPASNPPVLHDQASCPAACANLQKLGCGMSQPDLMGTSCKVDTDCLGPDAGHDAFQTCFNGQCIITCVNICISTENNGVSLNPACVATATSCESANDCGVATTSGVSCTGPNCKVSPTSK